MKRLGSIFLAVFLALILIGKVGAVDVEKELTEQYAIEDLEDGLSREERNLLGDISPLKQTNFLESFLFLLENVLQNIGEVPRETRKLLARVLLVVILCQLVDGIGAGRTLAVSRISGAFAVTALCITDLSVMIGLGRDTVARMNQYAGLLLPVVASTAAASGAATGSCAVYAVTVFASKLFLSFSDQVLLPAIYAYLGLSFADCMLQQDRLKRFRELLKWLMEMGLKGIGYGYSAIVSFAGILAGSNDALAIKGLKTALSTMVPVVGGIISGAADTVFNGAAFLKNTVGVYGMLAILAVMLLPFFEIGISWLLFRVLSALCGMMDSKLSGLIEAVSVMMGLLLGMIGCCGWILLLSCCCYLKVVTI